MKVYLGRFKVIEVKPLGSITIDIGRNVTITVYVGDFPHLTKTGDIVPLFTELPYDIPQQTPK